MIERDLVQIIPRKHWVDFSHRLIEHGRRTCVAVRPGAASVRSPRLRPKLGEASGGPFETAGE